MRRLLYFNFRIIYRISNWLRHRLSAPGLALFSAMIAAGIFGVNTRQTLAYQVFSLLAALLLAAVLCALSFRGALQVRRSLPRFATAGLPVSYAAYVSNSGRRRQDDLGLFEELEETFPSYREFAAARDPDDRRRNWFDRVIGYPRLVGMLRSRRGASVAPVAVPAVPPGETVRTEISFRPLRRGYIRFRRLRLARPDPFGLVRAMQDHAEPASLLVLPRLYSVPNLHASGNRRYQRGGMSLASTVGDSQEFFSLRDYKPGDPLRAVHWRSFAKLGRPVVKEYQDEFFVRQGLVLDTFLGDGPRPAFEEAVSVAASFAVSQRDQDALLDLMFVGNRTFRFTSGRGLGQAENMLEVLACVAPAVANDVAQLEHLILHHAAETSSLLFVLLDWDGPRQTMVQKAMALGIPSVVFVVNAASTLPATMDKTAGPLPQRLVLLQPGRIQDGLDAFLAGGGTA